MSKMRTVVSSTIFHTIIFLLFVQVTVKDFIHFEVSTLKSVTLYSILLHVLLASACFKLRVTRDTGLEQMMQNVHVFYK